MKYRFVLFIGTFLLGITAYSLLFPNYMTGQLLGITAPLVIARLLLITVLALYIISSRVRTIEMQTFLRMGGAVLLGYGLSAFVSPMLFGLSDTYIPLGDVLIWVEGGITAMLLSLEVQPEGVTESMSRKRRLKFLVAPFSSRGSLGHT